MGAGHAPLLTILKAAENYDERIGYLKEGELDGMSLNPEFLRGFMEFVSRDIPTISGELALDDNGNLRAVWNSDGESFVGLQFLKHENIEFIFLSQSALSLSVSRSHEQVGIDRVKSQIEVLGINRETLFPSLDKAAIAVTNEFSANSD